MNCVFIHSFISFIASNDNEAWRHIADARYYFWRLHGLMEQIRHGYDDNPARLMAQKRHAENYALAEDAIKYWWNCIDPNLSAEKAADELIKFVPLAHKTLAKIVSCEKKKLSEKKKMT